MTESYPLPSGRDPIAQAVDWKGFSEELRRQWHLLWRERIDDKVRAEGIADKDFELLFVERGTVIVATRRFKLMEFKEILEKYNAPYETKVKQETPDPQVGGWRKFGKQLAATQRGKRRVRRPWTREDSTGGRAKLQLKKGGRGWLHFTAK
jgi:hypothetical protein